jgi:hypothetical protein
MSNIITSQKVYMYTVPDDIEKTSFRKMLHHGIPLITHKHVHLFPQCYHALAMDKFVCGI